MPDDPRTPLSVIAKQFPPIGARIAIARRSGVPDRIILEQINKKFAQAREAGFTPEQRVAMGQGRLRIPQLMGKITDTFAVQQAAVDIQNLQPAPATITEDERAQVPNPITGALESLGPPTDVTGLGKFLAGTTTVLGSLPDVLKGAVRGLTLRHVNPDVNNETLALAGELIGLAAPIGGVFKATAPIAKLASTPLSGVLAREAATGGIIGGVEQADTLAERGLNTAVGAITFPVLGQAIRLGAPFVARGYKAVQGALQERFKVSEIPIEPAAPTPIPTKPVLPPVERVKGEVPPGATVVRQTATETLVTQDPVKAVREVAKGGRPRTRVLAPNLTDEEAIAVAGRRLAKEQNISSVVALKQARAMNILKTRQIAAAEIKAFRTAIGETTGKPGRPKTGQTKVQTFGDVEQARTTQVRDLRTTVSESSGQVVSVKSLNNIAQARGFEVRPSNVEGKLQFEVNGPSGQLQKFDTLDEVQGFLEVQPAIKMNPIDRPLVGKAPLEKAVVGEKLNKADQVALQEQAKLVAQERSQLPGAVERAEVLNEAVETTSLSLEGRTVGIVKGLTTKGEFDILTQNLTKKGLKAKVVPVPGAGADVIYSKAGGKDVDKFAALHNKVVNKGPRSLKPDEDTFMKQMLGEQVQPPKIPQGPKERPTATQSVQQLEDDIAKFAPEEEGLILEDPVKVTRLEFNMTKKEELVEKFLNQPLEGYNSFKTNIYGLAEDEFSLLIDPSKLDKKLIAQDLEPGIKQLIAVSRRSGLIEGVGEIKPGWVTRVANDLIKDDIITGTTTETFKPFAGMNLKRFTVPPEIAFGGAAPRPRVKFVNPIAQPQLTNSPLIQQASVDAQVANEAFAKEMDGLNTLFEDRILSRLGKDRVLRKKAMQFVQGDLSASEAGPQAVAAGQAYREVMSDFARRLGLPQWENYATHVTDFQALYSAFREQFVSATKFSQLPPQLQLKLGTSLNFDKFKRVFDKNLDYTTLPKAIKNDLRGLWDFSSTLTEWESLPRFIQQKLPREIFDPYLIPRAPNSSVPYVEDLVEAFRKYIPITTNKVHFDPLVQKWRKVIKTLPGGSGSVTEKGYLTTFIEREMLGRGTPGEHTLTAMFDRVNETLGKELLSTRLLNNAVTLAKGGFFRGALGLDSAIINLTQSINTVAEVGGKKFVRGLFRLAQNPRIVKENKQFFGQFTDLLTELPKHQRDVLSSKTNRLLQADRELNKIVLAPMHLAEFTNRGIALSAGLEEAAGMGLSFEQAMVMASERASRVVPNLMMSEAQMHALFRFIPKTQFAATSGARSPFLRGPLGRLSTTLLTFPTQQIQFIGRGISDAIATKDSARLIRFLAVAGAYSFLPVAMGKLGVDIRNAFGLTGLAGNMTFPFWKFLHDAYNMSVGTNPREVRRSRESFGRFIEMLTIPQARFARKIGGEPIGGLVGTPLTEKSRNNILDNIARGYGVDRRGRFVYEATPMGEIMKLFNVNPEEAFEARDTARQITEMALQHSMDKQDAIDNFLEGNMAPVRDYMAKWGKSITEQDLQRAVQNRLLSPQQRAAKRLPAQQRQRLLNSLQQ